MKEKELTTKIMKELKNYCAECGIPFFYHKVADIPMSFVGGDNKFRFNPTKFVDVFGCIQGRGFAFEFKLHKNPGSFAFSHLRDNQLQSLLDFEKAGGISRIVVAQIYDYDKFSITQLTNDHVERHEVMRGKVWRIFVIEPQLWVALTSSSDRKSVRLSEVLSPYVVRKQKVGRLTRWDSTTFLNLLDIKPLEKEVETDPPSNSDLAETAQISTNEESEGSDIG